MMVRTSRPSECDDVIRRADVSRSRGLPHRGGTDRLRPRADSRLLRGVFDRPKCDLHVHCDVIKRRRKNESHVSTNRGSCEGMRMGRHRVARGAPHEGADQCYYVDALYGRMAGPTAAAVAMCVLSYWPPSVEMIVWVSGTIPGVPNKKPPPFEPPPPPTE